MLKKILALCMVFALLGVSLFTPGAKAADYTNGVEVSGTTATLWFKSVVNTTWVDVHYKINSGAQQDFRMTYNSSTARYEQKVTAASGNVINYSFTYNNGTPAYNTPTFTYTVGSTGGTAAATPTFSPAGGTYAAAQSVTIATATAGAAIRYTTDGSTPTAASAQYTGPITVSSTNTIKAIAIAAGMANSAVAAETYTISPTAVDYTQGVTYVSGTSAKIWFKPTSASTLVDVHYKINAGPQQDFRMTNNAGTWEKTVTGLASGAVISYSFTYEKGGPLLNTPNFSYTFAATADTQAPSAPTGLAAPSKTATSVNLTWTASTDNVGVTGYDIFKGGVLAGSSGTNSFTATGLTASTAYSFTVKAKDAAGNISPASTALSVTTSAATATDGSFPLILQNNTRGIWPNSQIYVMVLGQIVGNGDWHYMKPDGTMTRINHLDENAPNHLTKNGRNYANMSFTLAQASTVKMPTAMFGGRIYISIGSPVYIPISADDRGWGGPDLLNPLDPNADVYYDWYEYTYKYGAVTFGGNTTQVDQFGFPMTARLQQAEIGYDKTYGITLTRDQVMSQYNAAVPAAFKPLANTYRIVAPRSSPIFAAATPTSPAGSQANYFQSYIDQVWNYYTANQFTLTRLNETFTGRVANGVLQFTKQGAGPFFLSKPTSNDVVRCAGALAPQTNDTERQLGAEFCAAFNRGVALNTANWYNPAAYYANAIQNDYSAFFHNISLAKRSYGFAYDDINDQSSVMILPNANPPTALTLGIGW